MDRLQRLLNDAPRMALTFGPPHEAKRALLESFNPRTDFGFSAQDTDAARLAHAALWLRYDFFEESHTISQAIATAEGNYWHAILHRRELDAANARYWLHRVGRHPVFAEITERLGHAWDAEEFFALCARHQNRNDDTERELIQMQLVEWQVLFEFCLRLARGREH